MFMALKEAQEAAVKGEVPVGAVIVMGDLILSGHNRVIMDADPTAHAEVVVLRQASRVTGNYRLLDACLYVTLEPCIMCVGAIIHARIRRLVYGAADPRYGAVESLLKGFELGLNHRPEVVSGLFEDDAARLLKTFFQERR
ncbi:MAG TPA: nucleoside deaminase [Deltaproteobacteria bacterium]|nr:nucleoside deaminase [Deltaproteobacteria bacterium]